LRLFLRNLQKNSKDKKIHIGVLGMARSGLAVAQKALQNGMNVLLSDNKIRENFQNIEQIENLAKNYESSLKIEFGGHTEKLFNMDCLVVSPGIPLNIPFLLKAKEKNIPLISEIEFAFQFTHPDTKIIAITGSNGKSTTASLIHHLLKSQGFDTILAGNIGEAYSCFDIENKKDFIVLEVSSFQLELINDFKPDVALILNITPDHLDRYKSFDDYALAKFNIFKNQDFQNIKILNFTDITSKNIIKKIEQYSDMEFVFFANLDSLEGNDEYPTLMKGGYLQEKKIYINNIEIVSDTDILPLKGPHNMQNILAALLAVSPYIDLSTIYKNLCDFKPLEHRLESVVTLKGVEYINDSKATNTESVKKALLSFDKPIHLILGGYDKGEDFYVLTDYMMGKVKNLYLIGNTAIKMKEIFQEKFDCEVFLSFEKAIFRTFEKAHEGEVVLLSPACASYDWFLNFEERGKIFKELINGYNK